MSKLDQLRALREAQFDKAKLINVTPPNNVTLPVENIVTLPVENIVTRGRPRRHASNAERQRAYRKRRANG